MGAETSTPSGTERAACGVISRKPLRVRRVVNDERRRKFPHYTFEDDGRQIALDVMDISGIELEEVHDIAGTLESYGRIIPEWGVSEVLIEVSIDGVRYLSRAEWSRMYDLDTENLIEWLEESTEQQ